MSIDVTDDIQRKREGFKVLSLEDVSIESDGDKSPDAQDLNDLKASYDASIQSLSDTIATMQRELRDTVLRQAVNVNHVPPANERVTLSDGTAKNLAFQVGSFNNRLARTEDSYTGDIEDDHLLVDALAFRADLGGNTATDLAIRFNTQLYFAMGDPSIRTSGYVANFRLRLVIHRGSEQVFLHELATRSFSLNDFTSLISSSVHSGRYVRASSHDISVDTTISFTPNDRLRTGDILYIEAFANGFNSNATVGGEFFRAGSDHVFSVGAV